MECFVKDNLLLTGGTGSYGRTFVLLYGEYYNIFVITNDENQLYEMQQDFPNVKSILGDVKDKGSLYNIMRNMDIVIHAAALKHVPICEHNIADAIKTNILGSMNVVQVADEIGIPKVLAISTDKAVKPINVYGATKQIMEALFLNTGYSCIRFGNFWGSRGSVIPRWEKEKESGFITITDPKMVRYWITLEEAAKFTNTCLMHYKEKSVFIPEMKKMTMAELAQQVAPNASWKIIGNRGKEKLEEELDYC